MAWDFETDPEYQEKLDWVDQFVREEVEPLDLAFPHMQFVPLQGKRREAIDPLKEEVRKRHLWATHLGPELGGEGHGQLKLSLLNFIGFGVLSQEIYLVIHDLDGEVLAFLKRSPLPLVSNQACAIVVALLQAH